MQFLKGKSLMGKPVAAAIAFGGVLLLGASTAVQPAEAVWTGTYGISASGWTATDSPTVAVDRQGDSLLAWTACEAAASACYHQVQVRLKSATGGLGPIRTLSPLGPTANWPEVATDDDGDSAVVWEQDGRVVGRRVSASGALVGPLRTLSNTAGTNPNVVVEPAGRALVVWNDIRSGSFVTTARFLYKDGTVSNAFTLGSGAADQPAVGIDRNGLAVVAWTESNTTVVARRVKPGYIGPRTVFLGASSGVGYGRVNVGVDRDGDAVVSLRRAHSSEPARLWARRWPRTGALGPVMLLAPTTDNLTFYHSLASDLEGDSMVIWSRRSSSTQTDVFGRRITRTGALGAITRLGVGDRPRVALDDDGNGLAVWHSPGPPYDATRVFARPISTAGAFGVTATLSTDGRVPRVDASPGGNFAVVWQQKSYPYTTRARFGH
ncbi:hypothetical protein OG394_01350 [Kribbella sp. NBC_01245]|uniref:hypothetical protein n=1 Tax=Kribbella sp. NBC_01245 TaxID=2903578 RepID=UPI002E2E56E5|nr:hypothetical protein [Kribbella sp. NBC_01245]